MIGIVGIQHGSESAGVSRPGKAEVLQIEERGYLRTFIEHPGNDSGVGIRHVVPQQQCAAGHGHSRHGDVVFEADPFACQFPGGSSPQSATVEDSVIRVFST